MVPATSTSNPRRSTCLDSRMKLFSFMLSITFAPMYSPEMTADDDSPLAERPLKRARIACNACKHKKQKCDGSRPACGNCSKGGRDCIIEDPSTKRHLPPNYIETLEARIADLEELLKTSHPSISNDHMNNDRTAIQPWTLPSNPTPTEHHQHADSIGHFFEDSGIESLFIGNAPSHPQYHGPSSTLSFARTMTAVMRGVRLTAPGFSFSGTRDEVLENLPKPIPASLPPKVFSDLLSDAYFTYVHPQYPFLHKPTFLRWEQNVQLANEHNLTPTSEQAFIVYMIYAIGSLAMPGFSPSSAESLYAAADVWFEETVAKEGLVSIQAILCCAMYSMRASSGVSVWTLSGLALRQCTELGLHRRIPWKQLDHDFLREQIRRRVFWVAYNLDRMAAVTLGRPFGIVDEDIDVDFPDDINDEDISADKFLSRPRVHYTEPPTMMSAAVHHLRLRRIWGAIVQNFYSCTRGQMPNTPGQQQRDNLRGQLQTWFTECPQPVTPAQSGYFPFGTAKWFTLAFDHSLLLLHRQKLVLHARQNHSYSTEMASIYLECAQSAARLCQIYQELYLGAKVSATWGALHILFLGGLTFLYCLWVDEGCRATYRSDSVTSTCTACTVALVIITERWSTAQPFRDVFQALASATQSMLAQQATGRSSATTLPAIRAHGTTRVTQQLQRIGTVGICPSTELLLHRMVE